MRFNALLALLVATFVASCASFADADANALSGHTIDTTEARRLRGKSDVDEERGFNFPKLGISSGIREAEAAAEVGAVSTALEKADDTVKKAGDAVKKSKADYAIDAAKITALVGSGVLLKMLYDHITKKKPETPGGETGSESA